MLFTPKLRTVYDFAVNIDFLDFTSSTDTRVLQLMSIFWTLRRAQTLVCSFAVNIDFLDFTLSVSTKGNRLYRSRYYLAV